MRNSYNFYSAKIHIVAVTAPRFLRFSSRDLWRVIALHGRRPGCYLMLILMAVGAKMAETRVAI